MINDGIIENLRGYLKDHYVLNDLHAFISGVTSDEEFVSSHIDAYFSKSASFRSISDEASKFIKKNKQLGGFSHTLDKKRKEKKITPAELYKKANIDRRQYSRLMGPERRHPSMNTVISFAITLRLNREEFDELLQTAGYALSNSSSRDVCIMFCLENSIYGIDDINALLFAIGAAPLTRE